MLNLLPLRTNATAAPEPSRSSTQLMRPQRVASPYDQTLRRSHMSWRRIFTFIFMLSSLPAALRAQTPATGTVTGVVTAEDTRQPLPGVNVFIVGTSRGALSGSDGRFVITGVQPGTRIVRAVSIGYAQREQTISVAAGQTNTVNFSLVAEAVQLREVVAIGYGTTTRREAT